LILLLDGTQKKTELSNKKKGIQPPIVPSLEIYNIEEFGQEKYILAVGQKIALVNPKGYVVATLSLSDIPIGNPTIGDFNNDGINDLIIITARGYFGYTLIRTTGSVLLPILSFTLLITIVFLFVYGNSSINNPKRKKEALGKNVKD